MNPQLHHFFTLVGQYLQATPLEVRSELISLLWLLKLTLAFLTVTVLSMLSSQLLKNRLLPRRSMSQGHREAIASLPIYSVGALGFVLVLQVNGLNLAPLVVTLGGLGVGVRFGLQEIIKNLISGLTLLLEGKLQAEDYVEFDSLSGYIKEISLRSTVIRAVDGSDV